MHFPSPSVLPWKPTNHDDGGGASVTDCTRPIPLLFLSHCYRWRQCHPLLLVPTLSTSPNSLPPPCSSTASHDLPLGPPLPSPPPETLLRSLAWPSLLVKSMPSLGAAVIWTEGGGESNVEASYRKMNMDVFYVFFDGRFPNLGAH